MDVQLNVHDGRIQTGVYVKPTDRNTLLRYNSSHPRSMVKSLPMSQFIRAKRITNDQDNLEPIFQKMTKSFQERGYPDTILKRQRNRVENMDRTSLFTKRTRSKNKKRIPLVTVFSENSHKIKQIIGKHWPIVKNSMSHIEDFKYIPMMAYRRPPNLRDKLVHTDIGSQKTNVSTFLFNKKKGCFRCRRCINCKYMQQGEQFVDPHTGRPHRINHFLTCDSAYVVYILWCPCSLLYIGETSLDFKTRMNQHRYTIRKKKLDLPVSKHFTENDHHEGDLKCMIVDHIPVPRRGGNRIMMLKKREMEWIVKLNTLRPVGLNIDYKPWTLT